MITEHDLRFVGFTEKRINRLRHLSPEALQEIYDDELERMLTSVPNSR